MPDFSVTITVSTAHTFTLNAESHEDALEAAHDTYCADKRRPQNAGTNWKSQDIDWEITDIEQLSLE